jgi:hypothetical protein
MEDIIEITENVYSTDKFWTNLFRSIYNSYEIEYVEDKKKNKNYINGSNLWYSTEKLTKKLSKNNIEIENNDHECVSYWDCSCSGLNKKKVDKNNIKYIFSGKFVFENEDEEEEEEDDDVLKNIYKEVYNILNLIQNKCETNSIDNIKLVFDKPITIKNIAGFNEDHRGSDHMIIKLPFIDEIKLSNEITLQELITVAHNIKSHKFDYWYELFSNCTYSKNEDGILIEVDFDHGS